MVVELTGWREGVLTISLIRLIMNDAHYGLRDAKQCVDDLLEGSAQQFVFATEDKASRFLEAASGLGAEGRLCGPGSSPKQLVSPMQAVPPLLGCQTYHKRSDHETLLLHEIGAPHEHRRLHGADRLPFLREPTCAPLG